MNAETESLRKSLAIYRGLSEVSGLIASITDYDELLKAILEVARRVIAAEAASLFLVNPENGYLEMAMASHADGEFTQVPITVPKGRGIAGWVFEHGESLLIPDAYADERFYKEADRQTGFRTRSILCAPLKREEELIGVLQVLNPRDKPAFEKEDLEGFEAYAGLTATAIEKLRTLERSRRQERVERDLAIAAEIQSELLSRAIPAILPGARFAAHNQAAANVGGDFYKVFSRNSTEVFFAIGDVSGKGISASLLMAQTLSALQFVLAGAASPAEAMNKLNATLFDQVVRGMFVTLLVGRMSSSARRLELCSAGHCRPVILRKGGRAVEIETPGALPLGILQNSDYQQIEVGIVPGEWILCFTDGLSESRNEATDEFFEEKIVKTLQGLEATSPGEIVERLLRAELEHRGEGPQRDDLTILAGGLA